MLRSTTNGLALTDAGSEFAVSFGIDLSALESERRPLCRSCLDWSVRRYHLAGALGAAILGRCVELGWARRVAHTRVMSFSATGERAFRRCVHARRLTRRVTGLRSPGRASFGAPGNPPIARRRLASRPSIITRVLSRNDRIVFGVTAAAIIAAAVAQFGGASPVIKFIAAAVALSLLAMNVSSGTEQVGEHLGPGATGVLQAALGNLPELLVCAFSPPRRSATGRASGADRLDPREFAARARRGDSRRWGRSTVACISTPRRRG